MQTDINYQSLQFDESAKRQQNAGARRCVYRVVRNRYTQDH
jgi:hypothetical protein